MAKGYSKIKFSPVIKFNGKVCTCPVFDIHEVGSDIAQNCCYDDKNKCFVGKIKDNPEAKDGSNCIKVWVKCNEKDCVGGEFRTFCLCSKDGDCGPCQKCEGGICVDRCGEGRFCDGDKCVDCLPGTCKDGKVCVDGKCVCPSGSKLVNGKCAECDPETFDVPCKVCIDGKVFDKTCDGACDPKTDTCVDCIVSDQCKKANECCKDKTCECCPGYIRDNCTGECVLIPPNSCSGDEFNTGCTDCTNFNPCTGLGTLSQVKCPTGQICVNGVCEIECSCNSRDCGQGGNSCADHPTLPGRCYCFNCGQNDCTSESGSECGPTSDRDACICNGTNCEPNPCHNQSCSSDGQCGEDCTCYNGKCVPCSQFSCTEEGASACGGANSRNCKCQGDECVGDPNAQCQDTLTVTQDVDKCELVGLWQSEECCTCPEIAVQIIPTINADETISYSYQLYKGFDIVTGSNLSNNEGNDNIADTEEPTGGAFSSTIIDQIQTVYYDADGNIDVNRPSVASTNTDAGSQVAFTAANLTDTTSSGTSYTSYPQGVAGPAATVVNLISRKIEIRLASPLTFNQVDGTDCTYGKSGDLLLTIDQNDVSSTQKVVLNSDKCRPVYFVWKQDSVAFRKRYIKTPYVDTVGIDEGLLPCKNVTLEVDCGCTNLAENSSEFCNPNASAVTVVPKDPCRKEFTVTVPKTCKLNDIGDVELVIEFGQPVVSVTSPLAIIDGGSVKFGLSLTDTTFDVVLSSPADSVDVKLSCCV